MDFTREELEGAALLLVVDDEGRFKWSSTKTDEQVAVMLVIISEEVRQRLSSPSTDWLLGFLEADEPVSELVEAIVNEVVGPEVDTRAAAIAEDAVRAVLRRVPEIEEERLEGVSDEES